MAGRGTRKRRSGKLGRTARYHGAVSHRYTVPSSSPHSVDQCAQSEQALYFESTLQSTLRIERRIETVLRLAITKHGDRWPPDSYTSTLPPTILSKIGKQAHKQKGSLRVTTERRHVSVIHRSEMSTLLHILSSATSFS